MAGPANQYKGIIIYDWPAAETGWSETWYSKPATTYAAFGTLLLNYVQAKMPILMDQIFIRAIKVSDIGVAGDVFPQFFGDALQGKILTAGVTNPPSPWEAILFEILSGDFLYHGFKYWHGVPNTNNITEPRVYDPAPATATLIQTAWNVLIAGGATWKVKSKAIPPPTPPFIYQPIGSAVGVRITEHRVGRPFALPVGRRRIA